MPETPLTHPLPVGTEGVKLALHVVVNEKGEEIQISHICMVEAVHINEENGAIHYDLASSAFNASNTCAASIQIKDVEAGLIIL